jgi:hypothetical protein
MIKADAAEGLADNCGYRRQRSLSIRWQEIACPHPMTTRTVVPFPMPG